MAETPISRCVVEGNDPLNRFIQQVASLLNSLARLGYVTREVGGGWSVAAESSLAIEFEWNNAAVRLVGQVPGGKTVTRARVVVLTAFSDPASALTVGTLTTPDLYLAAAQVDLGTVGEYEASPGEPGGNVYLTLAPGGGESSGAGVVVVEYEP